VLELHQVVARHPDLRVVRGWLVDLDPTRTCLRSPGVVGIPDDGHRSDAINQADHADLETGVRALQDDAVWDEFRPLAGRTRSSAAHPSRG
jgi:hypothetical protein